MKKQPLILLLLILAAGFQFVVSLSIIYTQEKILKQGIPYRFLIRPIDPADPFQGRYLSLGIENDHIPCADESGKNLEKNQTIYAILGTANGFACFSAWSLEKPDHGDYFKTRVIEYEDIEDQKIINIKFPFKRFYMEENKAPRAERLVRTNQDSTKCWVTIRFLDGKGAIENLFINGTPVQELVRKKDKDNQKELK